MTCQEKHLFIDACIRGNVGICMALKDKMDQEKLFDGLLRAIVKVHEQIVKTLLPLIQDAKNLEKALACANNNSNLSIVVLILSDGRVDPGADENYCIATSNFDFRCNDILLS